MTYQILRGITGHSYNVRGNGVKPHTVQFDPILNYHNYKEGGEWRLFHYNKFTKTWGMLSGKTKEYTLIEDPLYELPFDLKAIMLPPNYLPNVMVRAVIMCHYH